MAGAELVAASYRTALLQQPSAPLLATARGGNVIGGGDWSEDRLILDLVRSLTAGEPLVIRSPRATRPWQRVLNCLSYVWNFGPAGEGNRTVEQVLGDLARTWPHLRWQLTSSPRPHEAGLLQLDTAKAKMRLGWRPVENLEKAVHHTADWY